MKPSLPAIEPLRPRYRLAAWFAAALLALGLAACSSTGESGAEGSGNEGAGEDLGGHDSGGESAGGDEGGEEAATQFGPGDRFWMTRAGARLDLRYDAATERFTGTVTNITGAAISRVRVEVHLSNGVELGPTPAVDLAPGETVDVALPAAGQDFATWGAHAESGGPTHAAAFAPSLGAWAVVDGVDLGIEHPAHRLSAWYVLRGGAWTPRLFPDPAPAHQPAEDATWTGEWAGVHGAGATVATGMARVAVTLGAAAEADLTLEDVPALGTLRWNDMPVGGGRFAGSTTAGADAYAAEGQFGGAGRAGVVGHASGPAFRSVFYGEKD